MPNQLNEFQISYAQNREDIIINAFFPDVDKGFYIDIGANHPHYHSVTKLFYDKGWAGVNFEPNPMLFKQIQEHRKRDINLMQGLGDKEGLLELRIYHSRDGLEGISTFSDEMKKDYQEHTDEDTNNFTDVKIPIVTLKDTLTKLKQKLPHIHFMKVDVEGFEYEVLNGNDWRRFRPELICIESNHIMKDWRPILKDAKYLLVFNDGLNDYYIATESRKRAEYFDYAKVFLGSKPIIGFELSEKLRSIKEVAELETKSLQTQLKEKERTIDSLQAFIHEITPFKKHLKRQVRARLEKIRVSKKT